MVYAYLIKETVINDNISKNQFLKYWMLSSSQVVFQGYNYKRLALFTFQRFMNSYFNTCHRLLSYDYKNTARVDLAEVDFSFHEDNHKVKEMTEVTSRDHEASFIESYHPPRFMSRKFIKEVNGNEEGHGKPWAVISLILWLSLWKEKSTSGKYTLVVFLYSISDNDWRRERYKSGWMQINCYIYVKKKTQIWSKYMICLQMNSFTCNKQN